MDGGGEYLLFGFSQRTLPIRDFFDEGVMAWDIVPLGAVVVDDVLSFLSVRESVV